MKTYVKICPRCGREFNTVYSNVVYCSRSCGNKRSHTSEQRIKISNACKAWWKTRPNVNEHKKDISEEGRKSQVGKCKKNIKSILEVSSKTVQKILKRIGVACGICGWDKATCDIHHVVPKTLGGDNKHSNLVILCPNCHRQVHSGGIDLKDIPTLETILKQEWVELYFG